jgi:hypothetical protein
MMELRGADPESYYKLLTILDYFEDVAILLRYRAITFRMVNDSLGSTVCYYWDNSKLFVNEVLRPQNPTHYQHFERLGSRIAKKRLSLKQRACRKWISRSPATRTKADKRQLILLSAAKRAQMIALDTYPELKPSDLVVVSHSVSEPAALSDTSAMVVMRVSDGSTISLQMWDAGLRRYTVSRVLATLASTAPNLNGE